MGWTDVDESREVATWGERKAVIIPGSRSSQTGRSGPVAHRDGAPGSAAVRRARPPADPPAGAGMPGPGSRRPHDGGIGWARVAPVRALLALSFPVHRAGGPSANSHRAACAPPVIEAIHG